MRDLSRATTQCSNEFQTPGAAEHVPCFVEARLDGGELSLRYAAHSGNTRLINGDSLIFSLMKRLLTEQEATVPAPSLRLKLQADVGAAPDSNYHLLIEALTVFDLPVRNALACTHLDQVARVLGYEATELTLDARGHGHVCYAPTLSAQRMRKGFGL